MTTAATPMAGGNNTLLTVSGTSTTSALKQPSLSNRNGGANGVGAAAAADTTQIFEATLLPTVLPRILAIAESLIEAGQVNSSLSAPRIEERKETAVANEGTTNPQVAPHIASAAAATSVPSIVGSVAQERSEGPSIALGQVSDDDSSLYDFLYSSSSGGLLDGGTGVGGSDGASRQPSELSIRILRQARDLRDIYRAASRAIDVMEGGEWVRDEQIMIIRRLEEMRDHERQAGDAFVKAADAVLRSSKRG